MLGLMQNRPLLISEILNYVERLHPEREIVSRDPDGIIHRTNYGEIAARARRLAAALKGLGLQPGDRFATLAWNTYRHFEIYYGVTGSGLVLHTVNPRLFPEQLQYIMNHAEDAYVGFDPVFTALVESLAPHLPLVKGWIALCDREHMPKAESRTCSATKICWPPPTPDFVWPSFDENTACTLCYTSGTTGNPKGVLYSHRSTLLHGFAANAADALAFSARDSILMVVPLFHANAWSLPFSGAMAAQNWCCPDRSSTRKASICSSRRRSHQGARHPDHLAQFHRLGRGQQDAGGNRAAQAEDGGQRRLGGPARHDREIPRSLRRLCLQAWGMTETSPLATTGAPLAKHEASPKPNSSRCRSGRAGRCSASRSGRSARTASGCRTTGPPSAN